MIIAPRNWQEFQHYKDRAPPWIKLHKKLLDDYEFQCLPVASRALAPMLWLIASEDENGRIDAGPEKLAFRLRLKLAEVDAALQPLVSSGFFVVVERDASAMLAEHKRDAMPETEREAEKRQRRSAPIVPLRFEEFWRAYPGPRKVGKAKCAQLWIEKGCTEVADQILLHVEAMKLTPQWRDQGGKFIPSPQTYLNQRRFEDGLPETAALKVAI